MMEHRPYSFILVNTEKVLHIDLVASDYTAVGEVRVLFKGGLYL